MTRLGSAVLSEGLRKRFRDTVALDGFDLEIPAGTVHGMLGPNGAGKTTAVRIFATLLRPDAGRAEVAGVDVVRRPGDARRRLGLVGQHPAVDEILSGGRTWSCSVASPTSPGATRSAGRTSCWSGSRSPTPLASR
jgi:ABC-2 type transport system ATP-binding protein